jgi:hypothetical protein
MHTKRAVEAETVRMRWRLVRPASRDTQLPPMRPSAFVERGTVPGNEGHTRIAYRFTGELLRRVILATV